VIGGSSAVNATITLRGVPADYDQWAAPGNDQRSWAKVLPRFRRAGVWGETSLPSHGVVTYRSLMVGPDVAATLRPLVTST